MKQTGASRSALTSRLRLSWLHPLPAALAVLWLAVLPCACRVPGSAAGPAGGGRGEPAFEVAPYLVAGEGGTLWLVWEPSGYLARRQSQQVDLQRDGRPAQHLTSSVEEGVHRARLPVTCGRQERLTYQVPGMDRPRAFKALPCTSQPEIRFALISDTQGSLTVARRLIGQVARFRPDFVLHAGDVVDLGGDREKWRAYLRLAREHAAAAPLLAAPGNHDRFFDPHLRNFRRYLAPGRRSPALVLSAGPVDVVLLSSNPVIEPGFNRTQLAWLEAALASLTSRPDAASRWRLVLLHHAPFSSSLATSPYVPERQAPGLRHSYVPLFMKFGVQLVLSGHTHVYERSRRDGILYLVGGTAGGIVAPVGRHNPHSVFFARRHTVSLLLATRQRLQIRTVDPAGRIVDRAELRRLAPRQLHSGGMGLPLQ